MSRMRLMKGEGGSAASLVCLYCGAERESRPPYAVAYCDCRSAAEDRDASKPLAARAA